MSQETRSPIDVAGDYWATYGAKPTPPAPISITLGPEHFPGREEPVEIIGTPQEWADITAEYNALGDPWVNGRYALAAVAWGLVALVVLGVGAGP